MKTSSPRNLYPNLPMGNIRLAKMTEAEVVEFLPARSLFTFSWRLIWRSANGGLGRRKTLLSLRLIQKPEHRSQRFLK